MEINFFQLILNSTNKSPFDDLLIVFVIIKFDQQNAIYRFTDDFCPKR